MPKDFGAWFSEQGKEEPEEIDEHIWLTCAGCGKHELVSRADMENGDTAWYADAGMESAGLGVCGGGPHCLP
jgi:hypothetical protein